MRHYVYLADEFEAISVVTGFHSPHEGIPPPGTTLHSTDAARFAAGFLDTFGSRTGWWVEGEASVGDIDDWWHQTLGSFLNEQLIDHVTVYAGLAARFVEGLARAVGSIDQWPLIIKGTREADTMRWIKCSLAGTLNEVEEFVHKVDFGKPGADPNPNEADLVDIGVDFAAKWQAALNATYSGTSGQPGTVNFASDVKYTECGVVLQTITEATDKDGKGGNLEQAYETHWAPFNGTAGVVGTSLDASLPFEVACAVTLRTEHRGPSGRGRTYFPPLSVDHIQSPGKFKDNNALACGQILSHFFEAVKADHDLVPVVVSPRRLILNEVTLITVGVIPDSQRRRRWSQLEAPITAWQHA